MSLKNFKFNSMNAFNYICNLVAKVKMKFKKIAKAAAPRKC